ncbi:PREDICTED: arabinogalactan protein 1-like [Nicotiana attenuata]|uniref:arabinogalactan protein 1-like n=1 Tax=Nicotiana attenuata TaxID=49451 RepID=UPI0009057078|nr:PREDICTED: arabinogalactan protein 1-like [Nicotiana attenuata]
MAPKKKARIGQGANATPGVADDSLLDVAGEVSRPAITLPDPSIPEQTTPAPTPTKGTTIPPVDTPVPPPAPASELQIRDQTGLPRTSPLPPPPHRVAAVLRHPPPAGNRRRQRQFSD